MQGRALTPDVILSGNLSVTKTVNLQDKVIYHNGQYEADDGYDGLGKVTVSVHNEMTDLKATENGVYLPPEGYDGFDRVDVDVPDPELDTIHITQNGRYTPPTGVVGYDDIHVNVNPNLESKTITANGHYEPSQGKNGFSEVTVNVPERVPVIESKSITENGTYTAPTGVDGYSPITVNVPERVPVIESKSITENGTYTAPAGVDGYSPITVNVPLPANAYLKKSVSGLPQPIASFNDGADAVMQSLKVDIVPVQAGSGDPSPTNVRPISGWTEEVITVTDDLQNPTVTHTTTIPFTNSQGESVEVYGGSVDVINGKVKAVAKYGLQPLTNWNWVRESAGGGNYRFRSTSRVRDTYERASSNCISSVFTINRSPISGAKVDNTLWVHTDGLVYIYCDSYTDATEFKEFVKDTQLLLPRTTPIEYNLSDASISTLDGENNVFASTGDVTDLEYFTQVQ